MTKTCPICGREFTPVHKNHKYCCPECAVTADKYSKRKKRDTKNASDYKRCKACGKVFKVDKNHRNYCSSECRAAYYSQYHISPGGLEANCSPDYVPYKCRRLGQTSCFTCTLPKESCNG